MKRISNLFLALVLTMSTAALAQDNMNVSGRVISSSAFDLAIQTDAGARMNLVMDSSTSKPALISEGDHVNVVYRALDTGGFQAVQVLEGTEATEPAKAGGTTTRTLTNTAPPGTAGQTGNSRTTVVGTSGSYNTATAPARPNDPNKMDQSMDHSMDSTTATTAPKTMTPEPMDTTMPHDDMMANDQAMAKTDDSMAAKTNSAYDNSLPQTASPEPAVFLVGFIALGAAALLMRRRTTS